MAVLCRIFINVYFVSVIRKCCPHLAVAAVPVLAVTVGTGQETGVDGLASKQAAGAATTVGCPASTKQQVLKLSTDKQERKNGN